MSENIKDAQKWLDAQIDAASELVKIGGAALRRRRTEEGAEALEEAQAILEMAEIDSDRLQEMRARVFNELGVVYQRRKELEKSRDYHARAARICDEVLEKGRDIAGNAAATYLNLSSIQLALGEPEEAQRCGERAMELLDEQVKDQEQEDAPNPLELGAYQNLAVIYARQQKWDEANEAMENARDSVHRLAEAGKTNFLAQLAQGCQQMSVILFENERFDDALRWGREAEELSEKAYQVLGNQVLPVYIISQINLISYNEKLGRFADAEDCLWKALDVAGNDPRVMQRGVTFYETCRKQADVRLEDGNLPREEVQDGYDELMERVDNAGGIDAVRQAAKAIRQKRR